MKSDAEVVEAVRCGDKASFGVLVERYQRAVHVAAIGILHDEHAAEDVAQEAFVSAYKKLSDLHDGMAFGAWVLTIARRQALRRSRKEGRMVSLEGLAVPAGEHPDPQLDETSHRLLAAVTRLPEHERQVVLLKHFSGLTVRTIGDITGRPVGTVTKQISRAYARLRKTLGDLKR